MPTLLSEVDDLWRAGTSLRRNRVGPGHSSHLSSYAARPRMSTGAAGEAPR
eukprot:CAMPEP_0119354398 /NCGR_PEP_ID=MMETSP1334-20130426/3396_1 /TAXON_ID=127549 /ORGANISM="Calcidiscus leptoporus, Strain RCC1130" /LENGTH=50 /DNA_ID=CAMNT_0007367933 /DNA_START=40 /DNA_END=188 /DNA_ORIENTATION=-